MPLTAKQAAEAFCPLVNTAACAESLIKCRADACPKWAWLSPNECSYENRGPDQSRCRAAHRADCRDCPDRLGRCN